MRFLLILPLLLIASPSQADPCAELPKPSVTIKRIDERISYNTEYSYKSLTNIGASLARPGKQVLGLTRGNATVSFASNTPAIIDPTGRWECQKHIASIEKELTEMLNARFATGAVWRGPVGQTASRLRQELDARWAPYVQRQIKRVDEAQAKIDTAEEYERVANACNGEISKVLRGKS